MLDKEKIIDTAEIVGKTVLSVIPIGGALVTAVFDTVKGNALQKRQEKWKAIIEQRLTNIEVTLNELGNNDYFATMLIKTTELAMKTVKDEKLLYLANALEHSITNTIDEDKMIIFLSFVEKYSVSHIKILTYFNNPTKFVRNSFYMGSPSQPLEMAFPEVKQLQSKCVKDLFNDGLMNTENLNITMTGNGMVAKRTTPLGDDFLKFLEII